MDRPYSKKPEPVEEEEDLDEEDWEDDWDEDWEDEDWEDEDWRRDLDEEDWEDWADELDGDADDDVGYIEETVLSPLYDDAYLYQCIDEPLKISSMFINQQPRDIRIKFTPNDYYYSADYIYEESTKSLKD